MSIRAEFRDPEKGASGVVTISFDRDAVDLSTVGCQESISISVTFSINTSLMPANSLSSSGFDGINPEDFDRHEYGGHIIIANSDSVEASIPFLMILRKAARPAVKTGTVLPSLYGPVDTTIEITNNGAGVAQIDAYQLIHSSPDEEEAPYGTELLSADVRAIGYRILPVPNSECQYLVEFSIELWEQIRYIGEVTIGVDIYQDLDQPPVTLWIRTIPFSSDALIIYADGTIACTGFHPDHGSNSRNIVIRACSNDLLLSESGTIFVQFTTAKYPLSISTLWTSDIAEIPFPTPNLQAHSYDIAPGETLSELRVTGTIDRMTFGMHLVTNAYRDSSRTGAATRGTESLFVLRDGIVLQQETTLDSIISFPVALDFSGPDCTWYGQIPPTKVCRARNTGTPANVRSTNNDSTHMVLPMQQQENDLPIDIDDLPDCQPAEVPRLTVPTYGPTEKPTTGSPISVEMPTTTETAATTTTAFNGSK